MFFRFMGGGGTPFPIQNVLPVLFNMSSKNYIIATFLGTIPTTFVTASLGSGIEEIIDQNAELSFTTAFLSPEIYLPIIGFFILLISGFIVKKVFFKSWSKNLLNIKSLNSTYLMLSFSKISYLGSRRVRIIKCIVSR